MSLWKPFRGNRAALETVEKHDGYVYFCVDDGSLFFDYTDAEGVLQRRQINAKEAESLIGFNPAEYVKTSDLATVATSGSYADLSNKPIIPPSIETVEHQYAISGSKDAISAVTTWNAVTSTLSQRQRACIYANGYYVVCGLSGEVGYSKDGTNWTVLPQLVNGALTNITYGKGKFIIVDQYNGLWVAEETPISWTKLDATFESDIGSLIYANNRFVIAGEHMAAFSEDGVEWDIVEAPGNYNQITFGGGRYVAVGADGSVGVSYDGITWASCNNPEVTGDLRAVTYAKGKYIIGGIDGLIMYTEDFVTWNTATSNSAGVRYVRQIVYAENQYYAATYTSGGSGEIWVSTDGATWTVQQQMSVRLWCLSYNNGKLITAGDSGSVYILDLDIEWLSSTPDIEDGQYLWERVVTTLTDGTKIISDSTLGCVSKDLSIYQTKEDEALETGNTSIVGSINDLYNQMGDVSTVLANSIAELDALVGGNE